MIHEKLDNTPEGWENLVKIVLAKITQDKDKDIIKLLWEYTDGKPTQRMELKDDREDDEKIDKLAELIAGLSHDAKSGNTQES